MNCVRSDKLAHSTVRKYSHITLGSIWRVLGDMTGISRQNTSSWVWCVCAGDRGGLRIYWRRTRAFFHCTNPVVLLDGIFEEPTRLQSTHMKSWVFRTARNAETSYWLENQLHGQKLWLVYFPDIQIGLPSGCFEIMGYESFERQEGTVRLTITSRLRCALTSSRVRYPRSEPNCPSPIKISASAFDSRIAAVQLVLT